MVRTIIPKGITDHFVEGPELEEDNAADLDSATEDLRFNLMGVPEVLPGV